MILYTPPKAATELPVIDFAARPTGAAERAAIAREIHKAARETGFFYVKNHGVGRATIEGLFASAIGLLDQPIDVKRRVQKKPGYRGWEGLGAQVLDPGSPPDLKESWNCGKDPGPLPPMPLDNQWPEGLPRFREVVEAYYEALEELAFDTMRLLALSLELREDYFDEGFRQPRSSLRLVRYPPQPATAKPNQLGAGAHTDYGAITILAQDALGGLEIRNSAGNWIRAEPLDGTFIVNLGDLFPRWTNDAYTSSVHRVMNVTSHRNRHSIVYFYSPNYYTSVATVPSCMPESGEPLYPRVVAGEFSSYKLIQSRAHAGRLHG